ncbi:MAG: phospho-N-acetylmuramoyl-pentapeptide-transferase [Clostridia bacterium]|nr:phospho-N-acetylmuramoyl-pentapeptide-transferase [Clostridia bacterium]
MTDANLVFYLITFVLAFVITAVSVKKLIPILKGKAEQPIYTDGPAWHISKSGTPTMGGLGFIFATSGALFAAIGYLFLNGEEYFAKSLLITVLYAISNSFIGIIDDYAKIRKKENAGLTPLQKLLFQTVAATLFIFARHIFLFSSTDIYFSFGSFDLGVFYYPLTLVMLLGTVNSANLTDGVDGIASGVAFAIGVVLSYLSSGSNSEVSFTAFAMMGIAVGFLIYNLHPAKIFMGDTGSLLFGSLAAASCCSLGNPLIIVFVGSVYFIEGLSVVLQVFWYKLTKKRIFKMAPFHHHLEKCGWSENKIVIWAIIITLILSIPTLIIFV